MSNKYRVTEVVKAKHNVLSIRFLRSFLLRENPVKPGTFKMTFCFTSDSTRPLDLCGPVVDDEKGFLYFTLKGRKEGVGRIDYLKGEVYDLRLDTFFEDDLISLLTGYEVSAPEKKPAVTLDGDFLVIKCSSCGCDTRLSVYDVLKKSMYSGKIKTIEFMPMERGH
jgi:hypothetical protein